MKKFVFSKECMDAAKAIDAQEERIRKETGVAPLIVKTYLVYCIQNQVNIGNPISGFNGILTFLKNVSEAMKKKRKKLTYKGKMCVIVCEVKEGTVIAIDNDPMQQIEISNEDAAKYLKENLSDKEKK